MALLTISVKIKIMSFYYMASLIAKKIKVARFLSKYCLIVFCINLFKIAQTCLTVKVGLFVVVGSFVKTHTKYDKSSMCL